MSVHRVWPGVLATLAGLFLTASPAQAQFGRRGPPTTAITGGTVHTGTGDVIENGVVLIRRGKILAVGAGLEVPEGSTVIDASGRHVFPGLIDAASTLMLEAGGRGGGPNLSARARDGVDLFEVQAMQDALAQGVTAVHLAPAHGLIDGEDSVLKLKPGAGLDEVLLRDGGSLAVQYGSPGGRPSVMLRNLKSLDGELKATRKYIESWDEYAEKLEEYKTELEKLRKEEEAKDGKKADKPEGEAKPAKPAEGSADKPAEEGEKKEGEGPPDRRRRRPPDGMPEWLAPFVDDPPPPRRGPRRGPPPAGGGGNGGEEAKKDDDKGDGPQKPKKPNFDADKEVLRKVLEGKLGLFAQAFDAADILNLLDLQRQYHFRLTISGAHEAHKVAAELKDARIPVVLAQSATADKDTRTAAAELAEAGVTFALASPGNSGAESRFLALSGAAAVAGGLDDAHALRALTADAARILGVADRVGSLQEGRDADLVIASGPPLSGVSVVEQVLVDGEVVYQR